MKKYVSIVVLSATLLTQPAWSSGVDTAPIFTGVMFIYAGLSNHNAGGMAVVGTVTILGALASSANAANSPEDRLKEVQKSPEYLKLEKAIGKAKAREFLLDIKAGWSVEALQKKYGFEIPEKMMAQGRSKAQASRAVATNGANPKSDSSNQEAK